MTRNPRCRTDAREVRRLAQRVGVVDSLAERVVAAQEVDLAESRSRVDGSSRNPVASAKRLADMPFQPPTRSCSTGTTWRRLRDAASRKRNCTRRSHPMRLNENARRYAIQPRRCTDGRSANVEGDNDRTSVRNFRRVSRIARKPKRKNERMVFERALRATRPVMIFERPSGALSSDDRSISRGVSRPVPETPSRIFDC